MITNARSDKQPTKKEVADNKKRNETITAIINILSENNFTVAEAHSILNSAHGAIARNVIVPYISDSALVERQN